jgi:hypothetical protein
MKTEETFPLPWEQVLWSSSPSFPISLVHAGRRYAFTTFRLVVRDRDRTVNELALDDIESVRLTQAWWQRAAGTSTVRVMPRRRGRVLELANIRHGPQLALILQLSLASPFGENARELDADFVRSALGPGSHSILHPHQGLAIAATLAFALAFGLIGFARHETLRPIVYAADDPIAPNGKRRSADAIRAFMEQDVMPFARVALAPVVGAANVTCETCHGADAEARHWHMPGVRALPEPLLRLAGLERAKSWLDPQVRNAVYGYLAEENNQSTAAYMRQIVMPGMARVMKRPAYDFARSYEYNRSHAAVGCYHCHLVE